MGFVLPLCCVVLSGAGPFSPRVFFGSDLASSPVLPPAGAESADLAFLRLLRLTCTAPYVLQSLMPIRLAAGAYSPACGSVFMCVHVYEWLLDALAALVWALYLVKLLYASSPAQYAAPASHPGCVLDVMCCAAVRDAVIDAAHSCVPGTRLPGQSARCCPSQRAARPCLARPPSHGLPP